MIQPSLFDAAITAAVTTEPTQDAELKRCKSVIAIHIRSFFAHRQTGVVFHAADLHKYVSLFTRVAPGSPERILRQMKQAKELDYTVINRRQSLYRLEWIK